ncbi:MAG: adenylate kinase [Chlorobi bacterium]|nr:MAG: adenylate kinase [Chlorobi bacterium OLB7]MBK8911426.1 adenylate kinase [Chlorobiota bacterium]MBX7217046.1 adenylate kinase [Candidatus Kapabacteria bacterium]
MNIIFFGAPGVGKGTQAALLAERLGVPHISTGAIFRAAIQSGQELGQKVKYYTDNGLLVPDELTTEIAVTALNEPECANGFILDGFPRNLGQAEALSAALSAAGRAIHRVVYLTAPQQEIVQRMLSRGRADDNEEVIQRRLEVYDQETAPVLGFYRTHAADVVTEVNGLGDVAEVQERIVAALGQ